jgi:type IV pilus assembly protein PilE
MSRIKAQIGFTLIELMIAVAIVAILASIAYPAYTDQVRKARRSEAQANLMELASFMERHFTENNSYAGAVLPFAQSPSTGTAYYAITNVIVAGPPSSFTLTATAQATGGQSSDQCGNMTFNQAGVKTHTGSDAGCW